MNFKQLQPIYHILTDFFLKRLSIVSKPNEGLHKLSPGEWSDYIYSQLMVYKISKALFE